MYGTPLKLAGVKHVLVVSFPLQGFWLGFCLVVLLLRVFVVFCLFKQ